MNSAERQSLEEAQKCMRDAIKALPDAKDDRILLLRELIGADEEGPAFDVLLAVGEAQNANDAFWTLAKQAGKHLGATADAAWITEASQEIFARRCS